MSFIKEDTHHSAYREHHRDPIIQLYQGFWKKAWAQKTLWKSLKEIIWQNFFHLQTLLVFSLRLFKGKSMFVLVYNKMNFSLCWFYSVFMLKKQSKYIQYPSFWHITRLQDAKINSFHLKYLILTKLCGNGHLVTSVLPGISNSRCPWSVLLKKTHFSRCVRNY